MIGDMFSSVNWLEKGLDASWLRSQVISNNIANVDTVGFKSSKVDFESAFKSALSQDSFALKKTNDKHIDFSEPSNITFRAEVNGSTSMRMDGNNVDIDYESAELAKNQIYYNTLVQQISSEFRRLDMAINEGV